MVNIKVSQNIKSDKDGNFVQSKPIIRGNKDLVYARYFLGQRIENGFTYFHTTLEDKKRLPDVVMFKDGKTTLLFSVENNGKPPYTSFSSKVTKGDVFNRELGFLITYLKYLKENNKKFINEIFNYDFTTNELLSYLHGMIRQLIDENGIDFQEFGGYLVDILNNHISTLRKYRDLQKLNKEIENKEKELDKLKKQRENK